MDSTLIELVQTHEGVGLEGGGVPIYSGIRGGGSPLLHQEVTALLLALGERPARWRALIGFEEQRFGDDWEWVVTFRS